ncbi:MAG: DUF1552 domain-containing protein [Deltaproteobacteria bacterium]|nr:DUF1552 domain-containing protein [Deltaproteobacteria bacterium]
MHIVAAFACDLTRVATLMLRGQGTKFPGCGFAPVNRPDVTFHSLSHLEDESWDTLKTFTHGLVAEALTKLQSIPEGAGTMLDNTWVLVGSEIGPGHSLNQKLIWFTFGGKNLGLRTGQYLHMPDGTCHSRMLVTMCNTMGLPDAEFWREPRKRNGARSRLSDLSTRWRL